MFSVSTVIVLVSALTLFLVPDASRGAGGPVSAGPALQQRAFSDLAAVPARHTARGDTGSGLTASVERALVLYDPAGPLASMTDTSAQKLTNLLSRFSGWNAMPVSFYESGQLENYRSVFYLGADPATPLPSAFLDDVLNTTVRVVWINDNIGQLRARNPARWTSRYGFIPRAFDTSPMSQVDYKGVRLPIHQTAATGVMRVDIQDTRKATVLANAVRADGTRLPWAVRSANLIYVAENPLPFLGYSDDRYTAFSDLMFEALAPDTVEQHRALVRLEDIGPAADPGNLRDVGTYLRNAGIPFSFGVYPVYKDPLGAAGNGRDVTIRMRDRPEIIAAIKYLISCGGTMVLHGYTHQFENRKNPSSGQSGDDAEFFAAHLDANGGVQWDGPVPGDSEAWALDRFDSGLAELQASGLPRPDIFEFPHYAASYVDYQSVRKRFPIRYERAMYFPGLFQGKPPNDRDPSYQFFHYPVRDVYGTFVIPENLDYVRGGDGGESIRGIINMARNNLVVRDGVASFFYHPFLGAGPLRQVVEGIQNLGYDFVAAQDVLPSP